MALGLQVSKQHLGALQVRCMECWSEHGDVLANQYGGSGAMHKLENKKEKKVTSNAHKLHSLSGDEMDGAHTAHDKHSGDAKKSDKKVFSLIGGAQNALVAVQRYYSNISTDFERQQCVDLLLGVYVPFKYINPNNNHPIVSGHSASEVAPLATVGALINHKQIWDIEQHPSFVRTSHRDLRVEKRYLQNVHNDYFASTSAESAVRSSSGASAYLAVHCEDHGPVHSPEGEDMVSFEQIEAYAFNECSEEKVRVWLRSFDIYVIIVCVLGHLPAFSVGHSTAAAIHHTPTTRCIKRH
jgi:hypothetical protein